MDIACGCYHSVAITFSGMIYVFGCVILAATCYWNLCSLFELGEIIMDNWVPGTPRRNMHP